MNGPQVQRLSDGRLHLNHGPIDLIIGADGTDQAIEAAYQAAIARFDGVLAELAQELAALRAEAAPLKGVIAVAMAQAVAPHRPAFITPMAAVAGAVADAVLAAMPKAGLMRAYVNNGGDIALHLAAGASYTIAIAAQPGAPDRLTIRAADPVRGVATSGWRGRSWSLGIADAVTVLAASAADADAAATMIANATDLPAHPAIGRTPAQDLQADSDLGPRRVTTSVGPLAADEIAAALAAGHAHAASLMSRGLIAGAVIFLHPMVRILGAAQSLAAETEPCLG